MKIINNTDTDLVVKWRNTSTYKKILAGTFAHIDLNFGDIVIRCCYGHIYVVRTQDIDNFRLCPHEKLGAKYGFDIESNDSIVTVFRVEEDSRCSNNGFDTKDMDLHDRSTHDTSIHMTSAHTAAYKRIDDLTDAIKKSIQKCVPDQTTSDVKQIRNCAKEIMMLCNIIDSIDE